VSDIVPVNQGGLTAILSQGLPTLDLQPFAQEIYLTHFDVAGLMYVANVEDILDVLEKGAERHWKGITDVMDMSMDVAYA
jgi:hypothetical protein